MTEYLNKKTDYTPNIFLQSYLQERTTITDQGCVNLPFSKTHCANNMLTTKS